MEALITDPSVMEPMLPEEGNRALEDIAFELTTKASSPAGQVNPIVSLAIGGLVRSMNCYYSNLIEGHDTHPRDIDRALHKSFSAQPKKRVLQLEAVAHIEVQKAIAEGAALLAVHAEAAILMLCRQRLHAPDEAWRRGGN
jgi:hypothetical protein